MTFMDQGSFHINYYSCD